MLHCTMHVRHLANYKYSPGIMPIYQPVTPCIMVYMLAMVGYRCSLSVANSIDHDLFSHQMKINTQLIHTYQANQCVV